MAALLRALTSRSTLEDEEALPPRLPGESVTAWACRCRAPNGRPGSSAGELTRIQAEAAAQVQRGSHLGLTPIPFLAPRYPPRLAAIPDPPALLWVRGDVEILTAPAVALVGCRAASPYGLAMSRQLSAGLSAAGLVVVSGLARGIDAAAHLATLSSGGRTVGVLGCGLDRIYPPEHRDLASDMCRTGAIISEFPPGIPPLPHHFPLRNRIISGLVTGVVVVEAPERSGALITASAALEQGREVMVVPGPASGRNRGGHLLVQDGAKLVESVDDILLELGAASGQAGSSDAMPAASLPDSPDFTVDDVAALTGEPPHAVLARLLELELAGRIQRIGGGRFLRVLT
jgi:DNA processing protein